MLSVLSLRRKRGEWRNLICYQHSVLDFLQFCFRQAFPLLVLQYYCIRHLFLPALHPLLLPFRFCYHLQMLSAPHVEARPQLSIFVLFFAMYTMHVCVADCILSNIFPKMLIYVVCLCTFYVWLLPFFFFICSK